MAAISESEVTVTQAARVIGVDPQRLADAIYRGRVDAARCPLIGTRRLVERAYLDEIRQILDRGRAADQSQNHNNVT